MTQNNGKTKEISGRRKNSQCTDESARLVKHGHNSSVDGDDQIGFIATHSSGQNFARSTSERGQTTSGKVLERLEFIENAYLHYVDDQQQHLESRLFETKKQKEVFKQAVQELKQEIYDLVSNQKPENQE
ncbi:MAG: hypothetical protein RM347_009025 [Nostoc sp. ChiQUE02]|uniref:hypothetical protein n=1 Tax=Nostoc sp. ChiQUE02 TaxID=3075377 RepID=UPI002AD450FF|nr:hypothetical protein [Nostoc sp. ChiQUE02]MDZ8232909.1 hypothetical protein [Nostoc sp. ChiQUE02]